MYVMFSSYPKVTLSYPVLSCFKGRLGRMKNKIFHPTPPFKPIVVQLYSSLRVGWVGKNQLLNLY